MTPVQRAAAYLTNLIDLALAADGDGWCPDLAERVTINMGPSAVASRGRPNR
jgi:hypothetical protein